MPNDKTGKKESITLKDLKQENVIERMNVKIKIKNKLEGNQNYSIGWLIWKEITLTKKYKSKELGPNWKQIKQHKL